MIEVGVFNKLSQQISKSFQVGKASNQRKKKFFPLRDAKQNPAESLLCQVNTKDLRFPCRRHNKTIVEVEQEQKKQEETAKVGKLFISLLLEEVPYPFLPQSSSRRVSHELELRNLMKPFLSVANGEMGPPYIGLLLQGKEGADPEPVFLKQNHHLHSLLQSSLQPSKVQ